MSARGCVARQETIYCGIFGLPLPTAPKGAELAEVASMIVWGSDLNGVVLGAVLAWMKQV